jgi:hypothetical protein
MKNYTRKNIFKYKSGTNESGRSGGGSRVKSVITQEGVTVDLSKTPLVYGQDAQLTDAQRKVIDDFEKRHLKSKIEYGTLVDANGNQLIEKRGGKDSVSMPTYYYNRAEVMSHNHPRTGDEAGYLGGTFSSADMDTFATTAIKTMRASAAEGTYSITKGSGFNRGGFEQYFKKAESEAAQKRSKANAEAGARFMASQITYSQYRQERANNFNTFLVDMHNALIAGQTQCGYTYGLERRK